MSAVTATALKGYFETGDQPTAAQFIDVFDSMLNLTDGGTVAAATSFSTGTLTARGYAATKPSLTIKYPAHTDATAGNATITIAQVLTGILEADSAAQIAWTLPTPALSVAGTVGVAIGDCIDFAVINTSTAGTEEEITVTMPSNATAVGNMVVPGGDTTHDADKSGSGLFRLRFTAVTGTETYTVYRIA